MATYDFKCSACGLTEEQTCLIAERQSRVCSKCGSATEPLFSPPSQIIASPMAFRQTFGEQFGTSSEKDWLKANPHATKVNQSTFRSRKDQDEARWAKANKTAVEVEHALKANATLTAPRARKKKSNAS
jgi:putative FmdB family regulatory protein